METLRIHPFVDGNMRVSVAMLRAAIHRFGRPTAGLLRSDDWEFAAAFSTALRPDGQARMDRLIDLLAERIGPRGQGSGEAT